MKGIRFYQVYGNKRKSATAKQEIVAVLIDNTFLAPHGWCCDAIASVYDEPNSPVCTSGVDLSWLRENCNRVSEKQAREIHPAMFAYLD